MRIKKILIVFTDIHFSYSPSTLNLYYELKRNNYDVNIIAPLPNSQYSTQKIEDPNIIYLDMTDDNFNSFQKRLLNKIITLFKIRKNPNWDLLTKQNKKIIRIIKKSEREIIAVDWKAMWFTQMAGKTGHFLSLEIKENDIYYKLSNKNLIKSIIIQSKERLNFLFKDLNIPYFLVQNAPPNENINLQLNRRKKNDLVYCGSAVDRFGIFSCLDFLMDYPEYKLTIKGAVPVETLNSIKEFYFELLNTNRLIIDTTFLTQNELNIFVSKFRIGFAFYDFYRYSTVRNFNYYTAPSGKVFQYLNSGIPIVANQLQGFKFIEKEGCGQLIPYISSIKIKMAIDKIEEDYNKIASKAKETSLKFDFKKNIKGFIEFLNQ